MKFQNAQFVKTIVSIEEAPFLSNLPEIAVLGRSNVGKSTLLNHLFGVKHLVKTSATPGKTRALNFFRIEGGVCVDMPGYGYAAVSQKEKREWAQLIERYLNERSTLKVLLFLFDIRREPNEEDEQMLEWIRHRGLPAILVLTKIDKVGQSQKASQTQRITSRLKDLPYVHYSATKNVGRKELIAQIVSYLHATS